MEIVGIPSVHASSEFDALEALLSSEVLPKGDLIISALRYLKNAWTPVMAYCNDGRYCIDNSIVERLIRPLTIERKNKMAFW